MVRGKEKEFLSILLQNSSDGICTLDRRLRYTTWNPGMERLSGKKKSEVIGKTGRDLYPSLSESGAFSYAQRALEGEECVNGDQPYFVPETNRAGYYEAKYSPIWNEYNEVTGVLVIVRDITEQKIAQDRRLAMVRADVSRKVAEAENEKLQRILHEKDRLKETLDMAMEAANFGAFEYDPVSDKGTSSGRLNQILGVPRELDLSNAGFDSYLKRIHSKDRDNFMSEYSRFVQSGDTIRIRYRIVWADQSVHWISSWMKAYRDENGFVRKVAGVLMDDTELNQQEIELHA